MKQRVSLTCEVHVDNARCWSITRESGKGPLCQNDGVDLPCWNAALEHIPRPYVVIKVALSAIDALITRCRKVVAIGALEPDSLSITIQRIIPWLQRMPATTDSSIRRGIAVQDFFSLLNAGMFSLAVGCTCTGVSICCTCRRATVDKRRFLTQNRFQGGFPRGPDHWFDGTTDAVGNIAHGPLMWLKCSCSPGVQECVTSS
jgi:hypothetical protein